MRRENFLFLWLCSQFCQAPFRVEIRETVSHVTKFVFFSSGFFFVYDDFLLSEFLVLGVARNPTASFFVGGGGGGGDTFSVKNEM